MDIKYTKIIRITFLYILGIITQIILSIPFIYILISTILFLAFIILKKKYHLILFLAFFIGLGNTCLFINSYHNRDVNSISDKKHLISGKVTSYPIKSEKYQKFLLQVNKIDNKNKDGTIQVFIKPYTKIEKHCKLDLYGKINFPKGPANFGEFDYRKYYKQLNINGTLFIYNYKQIKKITPLKKDSLQYIILSIRNDIKKYIKEYYYPVQTSFLNAVLIGDKAKIPDLIKEIFIQSGTYHLLAISGLHVGLITLIFLTIFINFRIPRKESFLLILIFIIIYNLIIGYKAPILRSSIMFIAIIFCYLFDRDRNYLNSLSLAALVILLVNPLALATISFQMSFLATAGIIIYTHVFNKKINELINIKNKCFHFFKNIFIVSFSAQIFIFPVLMFNFKQFAYISFLTNLAAIPFTGIILFLSLFAYFFYHLIPGLTLILSKVSNLFIALMIYIQNFFSKVPPLKFETFNYKLLLIYLSILFLLSKKLFIKKELPFISNHKIKYPLTFILIILFISGFIFNADPDSSMNLELVFFNIKGKSILIKTPLNKYILIDSGYEDDIKKHILPFLKRNKIGQIDYLLLSNITGSRSQGIPFLLNEIPVKNYIDSGYSSEEFRYKRIMEIINQKKIKYMKLTSGKKITIDKVNFLCLSPPLSYYKNNKYKIKNNSLVLIMEYEKKNILFCSDIKRDAVQYFTAAHNEKIKSDIINMPDLNQDESGISALLNLSKPSYAVINKKFTHFEKKDKQWTIQKLNKHNIKYYFTKDNGAVKILINKNDIKIITSFNNK